MLSATPLLFFVTFALAQSDPQPQPPSNIKLYPSPWGKGGPDGWDAAYARARDFVSQLTLVEKVNLTTGTGWSADRCVGNTGSIPRLGFEGLCLQDGPVGVRYTDRNSVFPAAINIGATFSRSLMRRAGAALGAEFAGKGVDVMLGVVAGPLGRAPAGGRYWESFGPDPYLTGAAVAETVKGVQEEGVVACVKHFLGNEQERLKGDLDVRLDDKTMHEMYLWPFTEAVKAGAGSVMCSYNRVQGKYACENAWMQNYLLKNELDFQGFIMSDWGAQHSSAASALAGLDMSMPGDSYFGRGSLTEMVLNGTIPVWRLDDMVIRIMAAHYKALGTRTRRPVNFSSWVAPNITNGPYHFSSANTTGASRSGVVNEHVDVSAGHATLIREIAAKSIVLLKNEKQALPLYTSPANRRILALIGTDAFDSPAGPNACVDNACYPAGTLAMGWGSATANWPYLSSPAEALRARHRTVESRSNWDLAAARATATGADTAIVFANAMSGEGYVAVDANLGDRNNLTLWGNGDALIQAVASANNSTVVVLHTPGPVTGMDVVKKHPNITAILWAGLPGQESGRALADVLFGDVNPQGRNPFTWGQKAEDYAAQVWYSNPGTTRPIPQPFSEGIFTDYRHFQKAGIAPVWEFGYGLSYTKFKYSGVKVTPNSVKYGPLGGTTGPAPTYGTVDRSASANAMPKGFQPISPYIYPWVREGFTPSTATPVPSAETDGSPQPILAAGGAPGGNPGLYDVLYTVEFTVENEGKYAGAAVPQLYLQHGGDENPWGVLRGFEEVYLKAGESKQVAFPLRRRDVANWDAPSQQWIINDHEKFLFVGRSSTDIALNITLPPIGGRRNE